MQNNNITLSVVIVGNNGDHNAREFISPQDRQTYIEGREGSNYIVRIRNGNNFRALAVPSVDGVSVLDGKPASKDSPGYILEPYQTLDIPGWVVDSGTAAKFAFSGDKGGSYAEQSGQGATNKGVIGLQVFKELYAHRINATPLRSFSASSTHSKGMRGMSSAATLNNAMFGASSLGGPKGNAGPNGPVGAMGSSSSYSMDSMETASASAAPASLDWMEQEQERGIAPSAVTQTLGTGFGDATDFHTTKIDFKRGDLLAMMVLYYNDARQLRKLGIDVSVKTVNAKPSAFPADDTGCTPPQGWNQ